MTTSTVAATATATATVTIDLTQDSLHAVLARDKQLWQRPIKWTRAHLLALGIRHSRRRRRCDDEEDDSSDSEQEGDCDRGEGEGEEEEEETHHVVLPLLDDEVFAHNLSLIGGACDYVYRANALVMLLHGPHHFDDDPEPEPGPQIVDGVKYRRLTTLWTIPQLAVGPRTYNLRISVPDCPCLCHFLFDDKLVLPYLHSSAVRLPRSWQRIRHLYPEHRPPKRRRDRIRPFEPFITAMLISRAQSSSCRPSCSKRPVAGDRNAESNTNANLPIITTRLLFTHKEEEKCMYIYTAHVSPALLDRFRHPSQPPATPSTDPLIRLDHRRIPFEPENTFRQRLLAAVSITAVVRSPSASPPSRKRPLSPDGCADAVNRPRLANHPRHPLGAPSGQL